jgi:hypothetical protein
MWDSLSWQVLIIICHTDELSTDPYTNPASAFLAKCVGRHDHLQIITKDDMATTKQNHDFLCNHLHHRVHSSHCPCSVMLQTVTSHRPSLSNSWFSLFCDTTKHLGSEQCLFTTCIHHLKHLQYFHPKHFNLVTKSDVNLLPDMINFLQ